jgi:2-C-methyl-D-erythritol 4-phosphate cytidylyltransferase/2-C-methyl-D-erythritol 2,4-cyclodiphosphate synthase
MTIVAQTPKISPYKKRMKEVLSNILNIELNRVNIKATTSEKLGFIGREEGVTVHTVATINYYNWRVK